ncbi:PQQ-dependent sugar dehydrogenase [Sphingomonas ginkgonis]|uniref:PQQ-dependent sugar dehydrogenase n=1 Tax=Sphingomonas ginkgonis TaxID=2315330 RepID=A0A3R9WRL7_9SPHN|nr:PQQ-dependent sugar dehydrogenase [Sphingomonas ginkgonis]RST31708.1 PQQ-dependent sugar dehydrogenase [Sphingomonas ginkgonis]
MKSKASQWLLACCALAACSANSSKADSAAPSGGGRPFTVTPLTSFSSAWAMAFLPGMGNQALVTEKEGRIWLVDVVAKTKKPVSGGPDVLFSGQGGLLDVVPAPDFTSSKAVYLTYSEPSAAGGSGLALARATLAGGGTWRLTGLKVIWHDPAGGEGGQFGARIAFAPDGRSLFLSSGERQRFTPAQDPSQPLGKILHLTLDGQPAPGNPLAGKIGAASVSITAPPKDTVAAGKASGRSFRWPGPNLTPAETWSSGHRNPLGLAFAPDGKLWEIEMGPKGGDEVNLILPGRNYGWPRASNGSNYDGVDIPDHKAGDGFEPPKVFWNPSVSPAGLIVYTGAKFPGWKNDLLLGALSGQALIRVHLDGDRAEKADQWDMGARIREVEQGPDGSVYLLEDEGRLLRLDPAR